MKRSELYEGKVVYRKIKDGDFTTADGPWLVVSTEPHVISDYRGPRRSLAGNGVLLDFHQDLEGSKGRIVSGLGWLVGEDEGLELIENYAEMRRSQAERVQREVDLQNSYSSAFQGLGYKDCQVKFNGGRVEIPEALFLDLAQKFMGS